MNVHVNTVSQCAGGEHRYLDLTLNGGPERRLMVNRDDVTLEKGDVEDAVWNRLRSALKEAGANMTLAQWKTVLEGKDYKV